MKGRNSMLNCKNCGAPIDIHDDKCPYCNSQYWFATVKRIDTDMDIKVDDSIMQKYEDLLSRGVMSINEVYKLIRLTQ